MQIFLGFVTSLDTMTVMTATLYQREQCCKMSKQNTVEESATFVN